MTESSAPSIRHALCVHAHCYQPPRADPYTGLIPGEPGAEPYANFNEKITAECYRPNAVLGNFARASFDLGPTLAGWLAEHAPDVDDAIAEQAQSGNAMAQGYNHTILPLATRRDKTTQVRWGIADFEFRFGYRPRGMWLPETAVDRETLEVLAENGIEFTILAPWQATSPGLDTRYPHRVELGSGRSLVVFFYDGELSGDVSFNADATRNAAQFAATRLQGMTGHAGITIIASDGELYGHHQPGREHFLHGLLFHAASDAGLDVLHPAAYLDRCGVQHRVSAARIAQPTSWSCHHGVARWSTGCACTEGDSGWKYAARAAFAALTARMDRAFDLTAGALVRDPWAMRDAHIQVILGTESLDSLLTRFAMRALTAEERQRLASLLEGQYYGQWMHTSCGLFWEALSRLEMRNNLAYAAKALRCTEAATGISLEPQFRADLRATRSERTGQNGEEIYLQVARVSVPRLSRP